MEIFKKLDDPGRGVFRKAQAEISKLMEADAFPKFLQSKEYELMVRFFQEQDALKDLDKKKN